MKQTVTSAAMCSADVWTSASWRQQTVYQTILVVVAVFLFFFVFFIVFL